MAENTILIEINIVWNVAETGKAKSLTALLVEEREHGIKAIKNKRTIFIPYTSIKYYYTEESVDDK